MFFKWPGEQSVTLLCVDKYYETHDTVSIKLASPSKPFLFEFKAGQFVNLGLQIDGKMAFRAYSISSSAGDDYLQLTIKCVDGGKVSNFIVSSLQIGDSVQVQPPCGEFNCIDNPPRLHQGQKKALLISAGCGISPVFAMAKHWLSHDKQVDIEFLHIARSPDETIYFDLLENYHVVYPNFNLKLLLKNSAGSAYPQGRLNKEWLQTLVPDFAERTVYLCGPTQFMQDTRCYLVELGFDMENFFQESFTPAERDELEVSDEGAVVYLPNTKQTLAAKKGAILADVLEGAGLPLIVACRSGICGSCKCKVNTGEVKSTSQQALTEDEIAQGYVLACSATLESDVNVEIA